MNEMRKERKDIEGMKKEDIKNMYHTNTKRVGGILDEFGKFIKKGSVMDMAVGIIIGASFKAIVDSLVNDILMPFVGIFVGKNSFASLSISIGGAEITYGKFVSAVVNFMLLAIVLFLIIKAINHMNDAVSSLTKKEEQEEEEEEEEIPKQELLLTEIRDLLKKSSGIQDETETEGSQSNEQYLK